MTTTAFVGRIGPTPVFVHRGSRCCPRWKSSTARLADSHVTEGVFVDDARGVISVSGADRIRFLHNMTTNNLNALKPGDMRLSTMTSNIGRTIELLTVLMGEESCILILSKDKVDEIVTTFDKYIFPRDKVAVEDETSKRSVIQLVEPNLSKVPELSEELVNGGVNDQLKTWGNVKLAGRDVIAAPGSDFSPVVGYTFLAHPDDEKALVELLLPSVSDHVIDKDEWEYLRIYNGRPKVGYELTDKYNPLEAGLWKTVSFTKGCYTGQETIARLKTYNGVKTQLFTVAFDAPVEKGDAVYPKGGEEKAGVVTSAISTSDGRHVALAYLKIKFGGVGLEVTAGSATGEVVKLCGTQGEDQCADAGFM